MPARSRTRIAIVSAAAAAAAALTGCSTTSPGGDGREAFSRPAAVSNALFPLRPGTEFDYTGKVVEGGKTRQHADIFIVTDLTKMVDGVRTVVAWDRDFHGGQLQEQELAFFAQDDQGNVWNFGEYPEEFSDSGRFTGAPSTWIRGTDGAYGGIHMLAQPAAGARYREGLAPGIQFNDMSRVAATGGRACVPAGCYSGVLRVSEWSPDDPAGGIQVKYYAPGTGLIRVGATSGDSAEFLTLTAVRHLSQARLAAVREAVLAIDHRAYRVSHVYRVTGPAARR